MNQAFDIAVITAQWLSEILEYEVRSVSGRRIGTGQTGACYRLTLDADRGPRSVLAKVAAGELEARTRVSGGYAAEVGFYAELVDSLDVRAPKCWYAAISEDRLRFTLLLEDLAPRVQGVQAEGCTLAGAQAAIRNLAGLHAPRWNDPSLHEFTFLLKTSGRQRVEFLTGITQSAAREFVQRYGAALGTANVATVEAAASVIGDWLDASSQQPFTLLHGDYRLDNLMFGDDPDDVVAVDWQTASVGPPARDLAYFAGTCLEVVQRREVERDLVELYHQELLRRGVAGYDFEQCFLDYRKGQLQAILITCVGAIFATRDRSADSDRMFLAMANRAAAAIRDLGSLELL